MKHIKTLVFCFLLVFGVIRAQIYPVQISAQLVPPYSGYLPDYADPTAEKLKVILQFNDFSQTQYNLKLKFEIKGNGFSISTKSLFNPSPITLLPGQPFLLSGADLAQYLNTNNLDFVGINQSQYQQKMALPEGYYSICIKAYDYYNANPIQISNEACANAWFTLSDPPYLNLPICNSAVTPLTPQNIIFQWTPVNLASPTSAFSTEYEFSLWECRPDSNANPNQVVLSTAPIFSTTTQQTSFNYGLAEPPLNLYMKYIWRVRAKDITGRELFKNNGYSQICTFTYGTVKNIFGNTLGLSLTARPLSHRAGECTFTKQSVYAKYLLQVRKKNTNYWFDFPNTTGLEKIPNLEPRTVYECRVRGEAGTLIGEWSDIAEFKTLDPPNYVCNDNTLAPFNNLQPLPPTKAVAGLVIQSGQFEVIATQIFPNGPPGWYKGKGYAIIFGTLPVAVQWNSIFIDAEQRQQQGIIEAMTQGVNKWLSDYDVKLAEENATYVNEEIDTVYFSGNQLCYKVNGNPSPFCMPTPTGVNVVVIRDGEGNQYTGQLQPPPPKVIGPTNYLNLSSDVLDATDNFKVVFEGEPTQNYGFDRKEYAAFIDNYEAIKLANGKIYFVPNKSIGESASDAVIANYTITGYSPSQLSFRTQNGEAVGAASSGSGLKLTGIPANAVCVYAYCDNKKIGKLNVISLKQLSKKLVIVPVNGANVSVTATQLNDIYKQANVSWSLTTASTFSFDLGADGLEAADATLLAKYSTEMKALRSAYQSANPNYDKDAYYVFVVPNFSNSDLDGYMVRGRGLGFVKANPTPIDVAHELGHGAFGLEHTFPSVRERTSNNLLDYANGSKLIKQQWASIQNPGVVISWFDGEEDAAKLSVSLKSLEKLANKDGTYSFLSPSGVPITFNGSEISNIYFYFNDGTLDPTKVATFADGTLQGFRKNGTNFTTCFNSSNRSIFGGYYSDDLKTSANGSTLVSCAGNPYSEDLSKLRGVNKVDSVIIASTCLENGKLKFSVKKVPFTGQWPSAASGGGTQMNIIPSVTIGLSATQELELKDASFTSKYSDDAMKFIAEVGTCNYDYIPLVITVANIISKYPSIISQCRSIESIISTYKPETFLQSVSNSNTSGSQAIDLYKNKIGQLLSDALTLQQSVGGAVNSDGNTRNLSTPSVVSAYVNNSSNQCALTYLSAAERLRLVKILASGDLGNEDEKAVVILFNTVNADNFEQSSGFYAGLLDPSNNLGDKCLFKTLYDGMQDLYNDNYTDWVKAISRKIIYNPKLVDHFSKKYSSPNTGFESVVCYSNDSWFSMNHLGRNKYDVLLENNGKVKITRSVIEDYKETTRTESDGFGISVQITDYEPIWHTYAQATFSPFDLITLINDSELSSLADVTGGDKFCVLPAVFFVYADDKELNNDVIKTTAIAIDVITIASGPGAFVNACKAARYGVALLEGAELVGAFTNLTANTLPLSGPAKAWVDKFNIVVSVWGAGKSLVTGGEKFKNLVLDALGNNKTYDGLNTIDVDYLISNFGSVKGQLKTTFNTAQYKQIERFNEYLKSVRKAEVVNVVKATSKFSYSAIHKETGFINVIEGLVKKEGLTMDDFHYMMQKSINALSETEKTKIANIRNALPKPNANTVMQKIIPKDAIENYVKEINPYNTVGGYVTIAADAKHLKTYDDIYYGLRLDYVNDEGKLINFIEDGSCGVIRFKSNASQNVVIPGVELINSNTYPFTAHGFTSGKMGRLGAPEWKFNGYQNLEEAELWEVFSDGSEILVATYDNILKKFIRK